MNLNDVKTVLEALASGCSPTTGEIVKEDSILNERIVIRALESAIVMLNENKEKTIDVDFEVLHKEVFEMFKFFNTVGYKPGYARLANFFVKTKKFPKQELNEHELYGKYFGKFTKRELSQYLRNFYLNNDLPLHGKPTKLKKAKLIKKSDWEGIDFFENEVFNYLSNDEVNLLKIEIEKLGILKSHNLSEFVLNAREQYKRAFEPWNLKEKELLKNTLQKTNDLELLSDCFQRTQSALASKGKRLIYEQEVISDI